MGLHEVRGMAVDGWADSEFEIDRDTRRALFTWFRNGKQVYHCIVQYIAQKSQLNQSISELAGTTRGN